MVNKALFRLGVILSIAMVLGACAAKDNPVSQQDSQTPLDVPQNEVYPGVSAQVDSTGNSTGLAEPSAVYPAPESEPTDAYPGPAEVSEQAVTAPDTTTNIEDEAPPPKTQLEATDPSLVQLASGSIQLVEFFAFW